MSKSGEKNTLALTKPIKAHGEDVTQLVFRAPSGEDILKVGSPPFLVDDKRRTHIDLVTTAEYVELLADIPASSVKQMSPADLMSAFGMVAGFFGASETIRKKSSDTTTA